jgi:hypothetical protein
MLGRRRTSVPMTISKWVQSAQKLLVDFKAVDLGYPKGANVIYPPDAKGLWQLESLLDLSKQSALRSFWQHCDGFSWPDLHIGYFAYEASHIARMILRGDPLKVVGPDSFTFFPFGSDGGGGHVVSAIPTGEIVHIPSIMPTSNGAFNGTSVAVRKLAPNLESYLMKTLEDLDAFIQHKPKWQYML